MIKPSDVANSDRIVYLGMNSTPKLMIPRTNMIFPSGVSIPNTDTLTPRTVADTQGKRVDATTNIPPNKLTISEEEMLISLTPCHHIFIRVNRILNFQ